MSDKESRTEEATDKRKAEARKKGNVARSQDLISWVAMLAGITLLQSTFNNASHGLLDLMQQMNRLIAKPDQSEALSFLGTAAAMSARVVAPLALAFMILGIVGNLLQTKFVLASQALKPNFKKLDPIAGTKRLFSKHSYVEAGKQILKLSLLAFVAYKVLWSTYINAVTNGPYSFGTIMATTANATLSFLRIVAVIGIAIGVIDFLYQRRKTATDMRMTKEEVRQEMKQQDLPAEVKAQIRAKARSISSNRMMSAIKDADAVIVNPVHVAIALKYEPTKGAPKVVAKGAGFVAENIREKAEEEGVPLIQDIPLARTLHHACDIDDEIPMELFEAVAKVLAFVFGLRNRGGASGFHKMPGTPSLEEYEKDEERKKEEEAKQAALQPPPIAAAGLGPGT